MVAACASTLTGNQTTRPSAPVLQVRVVNQFPHDSQAFIQGLAVDGDTVYEGTGQYGRSELRTVDLTTGKIASKQNLHPNYFGEGITVFGDRIFQLTWKERVCIVYDKNTLKPLGVYNYPDQGWGLANDDRHLYMSDGSNRIRVLDPSNFKLVRKIRVRDGRRNIDNLNELEFVDGHLWANIWYEDRIAKIDPASGDVVAWIDCSQVYPAHTRPDREHVLNGIAYDATTGRIFITGKNWPKLYEIEIIEGP
ncbi:MAG: glutaminyl-peptide cyclotransferase [bacterium]|nr:glutaminyl-peptide cyclotransferase [bacterium]